jgi:hypothetical protein
LNDFPRVFLEEKKENFMIEIMDFDERVEKMLREICEYLNRNK